jgi:hypothetical protein
MSQRYDVGKTVFDDDCANHAVDAKSEKCLYWHISTYFSLQKYAQVGKIGPPSGMKRFDVPETGLALRANKWIPSI